MESIQFKSQMDDLRTGIAALVLQANDVKNAIIRDPQLEGQDKGEMIANVVLGLRKLEDAAMRFGKGIQASTGGESPLGGPATPGSDIPPFQGNAPTTEATSQ